MTHVLSFFARKEHSFSKRIKQGIIKNKTQNNEILEVISSWNNFNDSELPWKVYRNVVVLGC